jgi:protein O-mannosyl-transferase
MREHGSSGDVGGVRFSAPLAAALVFCATLIAYIPAIGGGFVWDDDAHVTKPALRSLHGLWRIWFDLGATQQYYPVLHSAFWLEHRLWGDAAAGYHLANILLHATAACLFGVMMQRLLASSKAALLAALLFALHPVCVESVAWISEQKNTLSTVFYLLAALTYLRWEEGGGRGEVASGLQPPASDLRPRALRWYLAAFIFFIAALLSKSVTATLPAALLVVLWWRRGRLSWKRDVAPLLPWFAVGLASGLFTAWVERTFIIGAESAAFDLTFLQRCLLAGRIIWFYVGKLLWPSNLIFVYPRWEISAGVWWQYLFPLGAVALLATLWSIRRQTRGPLAGALFFTGSLFPALGFFSVYPFIYSYVADHFQYLASLGVIGLACGGIQKIGKRKSEIGNVEPEEGSGFRFPLSAFRFSGFAALAAICILFGVLTWRQCRMYRDSETLYRTTLIRNPDCFMARNNLGKLLRESGRIQESIGQYLAALRLRPDAEAHYNLGVALASAGEPGDAVIEFKESLRLRPDYPEAHINLAVALARIGRLDEAIAQDEEALRLKPDSSGGRKPEDEVLRRNASEAHYNLGNIFLSQRRVPEAVEQFQSALQARPADAASHNGMGIALSRTGQPAEAISHFEQALQINPDYTEAHVNMAVALAGEGRLPEAIAHFEAALRLQPGLPAVHFDMGNALSQAGRRSDAISQYREALRLKPDFPQARAALEQLEK